MRQDVTDYRVEVEGERRDEHPQIYTRIRVVHVVRGRDLDPKAVARAVELSETRYCPASAMLAASAALTHEFRLEAEGD
jgi:putative redox protein